MVDSAQHRDRHFRAPFLKRIRPRPARYRPRIFRAVADRFRRACAKKSRLVVGGCARLLVGQSAKTSSAVLDLDAHSSSSHDQSRRARELAKRNRLAHGKLCSGDRADVDLAGVSADQISNAGLEFVP